jgi:hypothetical protein
MIVAPKAAAVLCRASLPAVKQVRSEWEECAAIGSVATVNGGDFRGDVIRPGPVERTHHRGMPASAAAVGYNRPMTCDRLARVQEQLRLYEHPLVEFDARRKGEAVEVIIRPRFTDPPVHTYYFELHPRDLDDAQFEWAFQRQLFDCLHDYLVEMFVRTPQHRKENQQMEREGKL